MAAVVFPDVEAVVIGLARSSSAVLAAVTAAGGPSSGPGVAACIASQVNGTALPAVTINRIGGVPSLARRLDRAVLDLNVWADTKAHASALARTLAAVLLELHGTAGVSYVIANVEPVLGLRWLPDDTRTPTIPRYVASFAVSVRPNP